MRNKFLVAAVLLAVTAGAAAWQNTGGYGSGGSMAPPPPKKEATTRSLSGSVLNQDDAPVASAVVYLKDTKSLNVRTYITNASGSYLFNGLSPNQDYEIYAEANGAKSSTKTLSSFDSRTKATINLRVASQK